MKSPHEAMTVTNETDDISSSFGFDEADDTWFARLNDAQRADALGHFGAYELLEEIGHGGQGTVYKARQPGTHRIIAIKRLSAGSFATPAMRTRFEREVEAASALSHANIVRVYGTECIHGQQILAMEWIDGLPIDRWALASGASDDPSSPPSRTVSHLLGVFALVCDAVSHAHQRGVLHRDLKPSNVLVDRDDQPHVLDFGLAKVTKDVDHGASTLTHALGFLGTPAFASPEHVAGQPNAIDARSDVYSLGVILYQMLTGVLPYGESSSISAVFDAIRDFMPAPPSRKRRGISRELDAIAMKAMEKDPQRRYQSVESLAADIRRYLHNETVLAHPPSAAYQARKFVARHRLVVVTALIVMGTLVGSLIGVALALVQTQAAQEQTRKAEATATQVNEFLNQMLATADPTVIRGYDVPVSALLDEAVKKLDAGALHEQAEAEIRVRTSIAQTYQSLGLYSAARTQFDSAIALLNALPGDHAFDVAGIKMKLVDVLRREESFEAGLAAAADAERIYLATVGEDSELTIRARLKRALCSIHLGDYSARNTLCALLSQAIRVTGNQMNDLVLEIKGDLAFNGGCTGETAETMKLLEETLAAQRQLYGNQDERLARTLVNLGAWHANLGKYEDAEAFILQALELRTRIYGDDHPAVATALYNLGNVARHLRGAEVAAEHYRRALAIQERRLVPSHYDTTRSRYRLGQMLYRQNKLAEAEQLFKQAMIDFRSKPPVNIAVRGNAAARSAAQCLIHQRKFEEAEALLLEAFQLAQTRFKDTAEATVLASSFVQLYEAWGKESQAIEWRSRRQTQPASPQTGNESE